MHAGYFISNQYVKKWQNMQKLTEKVFEMSPPGGIFDETVVRNIFPSSTESARKLFVHRAVIKNEVIRIKLVFFTLQFFIGKVIHIRF